MNHSERDDTHLTQTLRALAEIEATIETPSRVETAVMARWDASRRSGAKAERSRTSRFVRGAATAAGITLVGALAWQRVTSGPATAVETSPASRPDVAVRNGARYTTVAVVGGPLQAEEPIRVVRIRVARSALGELGIPSPAPQGTTHMETVDIEVLVGEDGVARGVRVPISEL